MYRHTVAHRLLCTLYTPCLAAVRPDERDMKRGAPCTHTQVFSLACCVLTAENLFLSLAPTVVLIFRRDSTNAITETRSDVIPASVSIL